MSEAEQALLEDPDLLVAWLEEQFAKSIVDLFKNVVITHDKPTRMVTITLPPIYMISFDISIP